MRRAPRALRPTILAEFSQGESSETIEFRWHAALGTTHVARRKDELVLDLGKLRLTLPQESAEQLARHITNASRQDEIA